jgi:hypothetical protein
VAIPCQANKDGEAGLYFFRQDGVRVGTLFTPGFWPPSPAARTGGGFVAAGPADSNVHFLKSDGTETARISVSVSGISRGFFGAPAFLADGGVSLLTYTTTREEEVILNADGSERGVHWTHTAR